jgi:flagellar biosynthesis/type III secretory pathway M-ring protein FliF/YscJ
MDFLKAQITRIQEQLGGLSATQKMLTASLLTIMVMTLLWWSRWAAEPEMSPILDQSMSQDDIGQIAANLDAQGIPHKVVGDKVYVPSDRKVEILAELGYSQALPRNFDSAFDDIIKQSNFLDSPDKTDQMYLHAKERTLAEIIGQFPGVSNAMVVVDPTHERGFEGTEVQPVGTVTLTTRRGADGSNRQLAESTADTVSHAFAGLARSRVNVIIDGVSYPVQDPSEDGIVAGGDGVETQKIFEDHYREKIQALLQDIPGVMVSVTVKVNTAASVINKHTIDPKMTVSIPTRTEQTTDDQTTASSGGGEPGAEPNTGMSLNSEGGGGGGSNSSSEKDEYATDHEMQDQVIKQGPGDATVVAASVRVPRSYFIEAYKKENDDKDPDDATLAAYTDKELAQIRSEVKGCAVFPSDDALFVGAYTDITPPEVPVAQASAASPVTATLGRHTKEIGVGALAVVSLFMVSMMVRKGVPPTTVLQPAEENEPQTLQASEAVVGSAADTGASLDGMELDEDTVKAQQMLDQVQQMVGSNPDAAANLVKRWMNR